MAGLNFKFFENFKALRMGPGVIAKSVWLLLIYSVAVLVVLALPERSWILTGVVLTLLTIAFFWSHAANFLVLQHYPAHALTEGAQLANLLRSKQGVIGAPEVGSLPGIENPDSPPLQITGSGKAE